MLNVCGRRTSGRTNGKRAKVSSLADRSERATDSSTDRQTDRKKDGPTDADGPTNKRTNETAATPFPTHFTLLWPNQCFTRLDSAGCTADATGAGAGVGGTNGDVPYVQFVPKLFSGPQTAL